MRAMKDSGISWIGEIPEEWAIFPARYAFSEIRTKNTNGAVTNALKFYNGTIVPKTNFDADSDEYVADTITNYTVVSPDTIMINGLNLNYDLKSLRVGLVKETGVITSAYLALWPNSSRILPQYANYLFKGYETKMAFHNMGAGIRKTLGFKEFKRQPVLFPAIEEQQRIVSFLNAECARIDAVMEQTRASIEEYKKLKQSIITEAVTKGIRPNRPMKDSGIDWIGNVPSEWKIKKTKSLSKRIVVGVVIRPADFFDENGTVPFLRGINIKEYGIQAEPMVYINEATNQLLSKSIIHSDDILIVRDGSIGTTCVVPNDYDGANVVSLIVVSCNDQVSPQYLCYSFNSDVGKTQFNLTKIGTALTHTSVQSVSNIFHILPPHEEQFEIIEYIHQKITEIDSLVEKKNFLLTELLSYKKSLIFEYVTGKKEVS